MALHDTKLGRPFKKGETVSEQVRIVFTPSEFAELERKRGPMGKAPFIKKLIAEAPSYDGIIRTPIDVVGVTCAGDGIEVTPLADGVRITPERPLPAGSFGLLVFGDSMTRPSGKGNIESGSVAFFRPDNFPPPGAIVCAEWDDGARRYSTIKKLATDEETGGLRLLPLNPDAHEVMPPEGAEIEIKGVFIGSQNPRAVSDEYDESDNDTAPVRAALERMRELNMPGSTKLGKQIGKSTGKREKAA